MVEVISTREEQKVGVEVKVPIQVVMVGLLIDKIMVKHE